MSFTFPTPARPLPGSNARPIVLIWSEPLPL